MVSLKGPGKIIWKICNETGFYLDKETDYLINQLIKAKVLNIKILNSDKIFDTLYFMKILKKLRNNRIGISLSLPGNELTPNRIEIINQYCDFLEIDITDHDCFDSLEEGKLSKSVNNQILYKINNQNKDSLFRKIDKYKQFEENFHFFVITPDYEVQRGEDLIVGEQAEDLSIELINKAFEYEASSKLIFNDAMDDIRALLKDRLIMSYLYMDYNGDIYINDVIKILCSNILNQELSTTWNQVKHFWNIEETKKFYKELLEEVDDNKKIFMAVKNTIELRRVVSAII